MPSQTIPIARGPLIAWHRRNEAELAVRDGWQVAVGYPHEPDATGHRLIDLSHRPTFEINGPNTGPTLGRLCQTEVPLRRIHSAAEWEAYRLTPNRAILLGKVLPPEEGLDVTGGWGSLALYGAFAEQILSKVTAVDVRERTLPVGACCQGPIFGVNTLFGRFADRFELHVCSDSAEFFWEVLLDAGREFGLAPAGVGSTKT